MKSRFKDSPNQFERNEFNEVVIKVPKFIDVHYLRFILCNSCFKEKNDRFRRLKALVQNGSEEISTEMDISRFVRRVRAYGIALYYLTTKKQQIIISRMAT